MLLIEDYSGYARLLWNLLNSRSLQFELRHVEDLQSGINCVRSENFDLILLDLNLPDSIGLKTLDRMRREAVQIPIIILSGTEDEAIALEAVKQGAQDYLFKGQINQDLLPRVMLHAIERNRIQIELHKSQEKLEQRVQERTADLARINEALASEIMKHQEAQEKIKSSLREKEILLKEIQHRVKNNLQIISSLISLQSSSIRDQKTLDLFQDTQDRIQSIALIYEQLHLAPNISKIHFAEYVRNLIFHILRSHGVDSQRIQVDLRLEDVTFGVDVATPCGLIINELMCNALKYAFPRKRKGRIVIEFRSELNGGYELSISDNGIGLKANDESKRGTSLGFDLVRRLTEQLSGHCSIQNDQGTQVKIIFSV